MWSLLSAPLLIGCDMEKLDPFTLSLLTNDEVLAVNQDALWARARLKSPVRPLRFPRTMERRPPTIPAATRFVYSKELEDGRLAVGLFNVGPTEMSVSVNFSDLKLSGRQKVRDLWRQKDMGSFSDSLQRNRSLTRRRTRQNRYAAPLTHD